ncbi:MAG: hypothetical protein ACK4TA_26185 [Saprospiraceae bacterium]
MKALALTILISLVLACSTPPQAGIADFWADFQKAVAANNKEAVADMTLFPFGGTDGMAENIGVNGMTREQFLAFYDQIFDEKVKATIAQTSVNELNKYTPPKDAALESMKLPANTAVYSFMVAYIFDEGMETQTESTVTFYFLKQKNGIKLAYMQIAG